MQCPLGLLVGGQVRRRPAGFHLQHGGQQPGGERYRCQVQQRHQAPGPGRDAVRKGDGEVQQQSHRQGIQPVRQQCSQQLPGRTQTQVVFRAVDQDHHRQGHGHGVEQQHVPLHLPVPGHQHGEQPEEKAHHDVDDDGGGGNGWGQCPASHHGQ